MTGLLFHSGDNLLFSCNGQTGESRQWSKKNFWMVGWTPNFFQVEDWPVDEARAIFGITAKVDGSTPF